MPIHVADHGAVRLLTLDRPERKNALDQAHYRALSAMLAGAAADDAVHVAVLTGAGDVFCAGQDLQEMARLAAGETLDDGPADGFPLLLDQLVTFPKPLIAAVNGAGAGAGMTLLLHCDIVFVADRARLRVPFAELGVPPEAASSALLADRVGWQRAAELLFTARWVSAPEAVTIGLALACLPTAELLGEAMALAREIAGQNPSATRVAKELMLASRAERTRAARQREDAQFAALFRRGPQAAPGDV